MSESAGDLVVKVNPPLIQTSPSRGLLWQLPGTRCDVVHGFAPATAIRERDATHQWGVSRGGSRSREESILECPLTALPDPVSSQQAVLLSSGGHGPANSSAGAFGPMDDEDSEKPTSVHVNRTVIRCLFVLLPVGLPVMVYLKDVEFTRRIFLATLVLVIVVLVSCTLMTFIRKCRSGQLHAAHSNTDIAQRHLMAVTHRLMPRGTTVAHGRLHRVHVESCPGEGRCLTGHHHDHLTVHYHLAPGRSRSPSPNRFGSPYYVHRSPLPSPLRSPLRASSPYADYPIEGSDVVVARPVKDDPPPYEEALRCPLAPTHRKDTDEDEAREPEQPPPAYDGTMK